MVIDARRTVAYLVLSTAPGSNVVEMALLPMVDDDRCNVVRLILSVLAVVVVFVDGFWFWEISIELLLLLLVVPSAPS